LGNLYRESGNYAQAEKYHKLAWDQDPSEGYAGDWQGSVAATQGEKEKAEAIILKLQDIHQKTGGSAREISRIYLYLGENDRGFEWANIACDERCPSLLWIKVNHEWDHVRNDARYSALLQRLRLPQK